MKIKVGRNEIQVSGKDEREVIEQASFFGQLPAACGHCDSEEIGFCHSCAQNQYDYYFLKCKGCGWEYKMGIRKSDHKLFPKPEKNNDKGWVAPYQGPGRDEDEDQSQPPQRRESAPEQRSSRPPARREIPNEPPDGDDDNIPFARPHYLMVGAW